MKTIALKCHRWLAAVIAVTILGGLISQPTAFGQYVREPPKDLPPGPKPSAEAMGWLAQQKGRVSARDWDLLRRSQDTLYGNLIDGPWRPLRGISPSPYVYLGV